MHSNIENSITDTLKIKILISNEVHVLGVLYMHRIWLDHSYYGGILIIIGTMNWYNIHIIVASLLLLLAANTICSCRLLWLTIAAVWWKIIFQTLTPIEITAWAIASRGVIEASCLSINSEMLATHINTYLMHTRTHNLTVGNHDLL